MTIRCRTASVLRTIKRAAAAADEVAAAYSADANPGLVSFTVRFDEESALAGYPKAGLWSRERVPTTWTCSSSSRS